MNEQEEIELLKQKELSQMELTSVCDTAVEAFQQGKYEIAVQLFILLYQKGFARDEMIRTILDCYYEPNMFKLKECYDKNITLLKKYPFIMKKDFPEFESLHIKPIPTAEGRYDLFDEKADAFFGAYEVKSRKDERPFFQDLEQQILVKNESNPWNIAYLCDNVRRSEDYGGDNHIYLYYDSFELFCCYLQVMDITAYLGNQKLVFIFGQAQLDAYYPLDFKQLFGIDYEAMGCKPVRVDEVNRLCFGHQVTWASGVTFVLEVMDFHPNLLTVPIDNIFPLLYESILKGKSALEISSLLKQEKSILTRISSGYQYDEDVPRINAFFKANGFDILREAALLLKKVKKPTKAMWMKAFYLAYSYSMGREFKSRVAPVLYFHAHWLKFNKDMPAQMGAVLWIMDLIPQFDSFYMASYMRDICAQFGCDLDWHVKRMWDRHGYTGSDRTTPYLIDKMVHFYRYAFLLDIIKAESDKAGNSYNELYWEKTVRMVRFEDMKLHPKATMTALCEFIDVPWSDTFMECTYQGEKLYDDHGFNPASLYKKREEILNVFDHYRIELLASGIFESWGYKNKYYDGTKYTAQEIIQMCVIPFKIEMIEKAMENFNKTAYEQERMQFIQMVYNWISDERQRQVKNRRPVVWLKPKAELLNGELFQ